MLLSWTSLVHAHAIVLSSRPAVDAVVSGPAVPLQLRFNSRIDRHRSRLVLLAPNGGTTELPIRAAEAADLVSTPEVELKPGHYRLRWQVMSVDGHITRGELPFSVAR